MSNDVPDISDINSEEVQEIGRKMKRLKVGDRVKVTSSHRDSYVLGKVVEKKNQVNDKEYYEAIMEDFEKSKYELHANWRDIMPDSDDQETPYTGLIREPFNDTAPPITDITVISA